MHKKIFSLPFNFGIGEKGVNGTLIPFIKEYKELLFDIYFTFSIPPFRNDAMGLGNTIKNQDEYEEIFKFMMWCQDRFGVTVSATFNNFTVEPSYKNLEIFIENLKPYYDRGLRSMTIPHVHWAAIGEIKKAFPDLYLKNTVLRRVYNPQEYADHSQAGFDLINIDRSSIRDKDNLKMLQKAYKRYKKPIALLVNETCRGRCPIRDEHYALNCSNNLQTPYFFQRISEVSCAKWRKEIPYFHLIVSDMAIYRKDFDEILEYVQVLKLHGRSIVELFYDSLDIVKQYADGNVEVVYKRKKEWIDRFMYDQDMLKRWEEYVKNCKFQCWNCILCEQLHQTARKT
ncbi:MAG: hypothetical protein ACOYVK_14170 [Bacillota bacterium]